MKQSAFTTPPTTAKAPTLDFDVMLRDRWICTMRMPLGLPVDYEGDRPVFSLRRGQIEAYVEARRPSLKGQDWHAELITKKPQWRN